MSKRRQLSRHWRMAAVMLLMIGALAALSGSVWAKTSAPQRPTGLSSSAAHDSVTLAWDDPADDSITHYRILRRDRDLDPPGVFSAITDDTGSAATSYTDAGVEPLKRYVYRVVAVNAQGTSPTSSYTNADTPAAPLAVVTPSLPSLPQPPETPAGVGGALWRATMQVAQDPLNSSLLGYSTWNGLGAISASQFSFSADQIRVHFITLNRNNGTLFLGLSAWLSAAATLRIGDADFALAGAARSIGASRMYEWPASGLTWTAGGELTVGLMLPPLPPAGLRAEATHDSVRLEWDEPADDSISGYQVLRRHPATDPPGQFTAMEPDSGSTATSYTDPSVDQLTRYVYRVVALNPAGDSPRSGFVNIETPPEQPKPDSPTGLSATLGGNVVDLSWDAAEAGRVARYKVMRTYEIANGNLALETLTNNLPATATGYRVTQVPAPNSRTGYLLSAVNRTGSANRTVWLELAPATPTDLSASATSDLVALSWTYPADGEPDRYEVRRRVSAQGELFESIADLAASAGTAYRDESVAPGTAYEYLVRAVGEHGTSEVSNTVAVETPAIAELASIVLSGLPELEFDPAQSHYDVDVPTGTTATTVGTGGASDDAVVDIRVVRSSGTLQFDDASAEDGYVVQLSSSGQTLILVQSEDGKWEVVYVVRVSESEAGSEADPAHTALTSGKRARRSLPRSVGTEIPSESDASLSALSLSAGTLAPAFSSTSYTYNASVEATVAQVTVTATTNASDAELLISPADADTDSNGHQVDLHEAPPGGEPTRTAITLIVRSSDGNHLASYVLYVTRAAPELLTAQQDDVSATAGFVQLDAGWGHVCAIRVDGTLACWGGHAHWRGPYAEQIETPEGIYVQVVSGNGYSCAVRPDGSVNCWGTHASVLQTNSGVATTATGNDKLIHGHSYFNGCRLQADQSVQCFLFSNGRSMNPVESVRVGPFESVSAGTFFACGLKTDDTVVCWRKTSVTEQGVAPVELFTMPDASTTYDMFSTGSHLNCGIKSSDKSLLCWTWDYRDDMGYHTLLPYLGRHTEQTDEPSGQFKYVDTGSGRLACGVTTDGDVDCWGDGAMFSDSLASDLSSPPDEGEIDYETVSIDWDFFACGLRTDKSIACWASDIVDRGPPAQVINYMPPLESPWRNNADLLGLSLSAGRLSPSFDRDTTAYSVSVGNAVSSVSVMPTLTNTLATYAVSANTDSDVQDETVDLAVGVNVISVTVTSADDSVTQTYTVTVTRASS